ncbi:hypothetical protein NC653_004362 [Populus alba x Populus x berolinensis]|uniref:Uncharacterized protein n=1 Tax=Populus alba x Populus x berolinensis TaxID=444605 RepID=A0AAD6RTU4_9ROSI|nr:hypothetical protein NC653_004362 [Populus alba x Populus x berolinensis]
MQSCALAMCRIQCNVNRPIMFRCYINANK